MQALFNGTGHGRRLFKIFLMLLAFGSAASVAKADLGIISATWSAGDTHMDVTRIVQSLVRDGGLHFIANTATLGDPGRGQRKQLVVIFFWNGTRYVQTVDENQQVSIGQPVPITGDPRVNRAEVDKLHAMAKGARDVSPTPIGVELVKGGAIRTREGLSVPCRIDVTVATDATNIRLLFGDKGMVIFNWERNPTELRYHTPSEGKELAIAGKGQVPINTWLHISWILENDRSTLLVDGQPRVVLKDNNAGLSGTAGIRAEGSTLEVTQLDFSQLEMASKEPAPSAPAPAVVPQRRVMANPDPVDVAGPAVPIKRRQSEIKALYVKQEEGGEMLGLASELILTATPGSPRGYTPVTFVSAVGDQMTAVLDDVLRSVHVNYPKWAASKVELSFEDRYTPKDGGSIGAAIGTLLLSMIQGFEIDPKVAMTGDVTADGRLRQIGGVAAKARGATAAGCNVMILPAENYDQVVDAMVYEGPSLIMDIQMIGADTLEEATAAARVDRSEKLNQALDAFSSLVPILKKYPERVHTKPVQDKLQHVLDLAPNHISAKLLLAVAQNKAPRKLSATASLYYAFVPVQTMLPTLFEPAESGKMQQATPLIVQQGLVSVRKLRGKADPKVLPFIDSMIDLVQTINQVNTGRRPIEDIEPKRQRFIDQLNKLQTDRTLMEKMLHEGI